MQRRWRRKSHEKREQTYRPNLFLVRSVFGGEAMTDPSRDAKPPAHHVVLGLRVTGGFLAGADLEFADGLNLSGRRN